MDARNLTSIRNSLVSIDPLRVDAFKLKKAKRILGAESDLDALKKTLGMVIAN